MTTLNDDEMLTTPLSATASTGADADQSDPAGGDADQSDSSGGDADSTDSGGDADQGDS